MKPKKRAPKRIEAVAGWVLRRGRALAVRRPARGLLGGLWELPGGDLQGRERPDAGLRRAMRERVGLAVGAAKKVGSVEHVFTHRKLRLHVFRCEIHEGRVRLDGFDAHRWISPRAVTELPQGAVTRKALDLLERRA